MCCVWVCHKVIDEIQEKTYLQNNQWKPRMRKRLNCPNRKIKNCFRFLPQREIKSSASLTVLLDVVNDVFDQCRNLVAADRVHVRHFLQRNAKNPSGAGWALALVAWQRRHALPHGLFLRHLLLTTIKLKPYVFPKTKNPPKHFNEGKNEQVSCQKTHLL